MLVFGFLCCDRCLLLFVAFFSLLQEVKVIVHGWLCFSSYAMAFWFISFWSWKPKSPFFLFACFSISSCELFSILSMAVLCFFAESLPSVCFHFACCACLCLCLCYLFPLILELFLGVFLTFVLCFLTFMLCMTVILELFLGVFLTFVLCFLTFNELGLFFSLALVRCLVWL